MANPPQSTVSDPASELTSLLPFELLAELIALARVHGAEFAEVYGEHTVRSGFTLEEDRVRTSEYAVLEGVGVRAVRGDQTGYAYADGFSPEALREAARVAARIARDGASAARGDQGPRAFRVVDAPAPFRLERPAPIALDEAGKVALCRRANALTGPARRVPPEPHGRCE